MESLSTFANISGPIPERPYILGGQGAKQCVGKQLWGLGNSQPRENFEIFTLI